MNPFWYLIHSPPSFYIHNPEPLLVSDTLTSSFYIHNPEPLLVSDTLTSSFYIQNPEPLLVSDTLTSLLLYSESRTPFWYPIHSPPPFIFIILNPFWYLIHSPPSFYIHNPEPLLVSDTLTSLLLYS